MRSDDLKAKLYSEYNIDVIDVPLSRLSACAALINLYVKHKAKEMAPPDEVK